MKTKIYLKILVAVLISLPTLTYAQGVAINEDDSEADPSAMLDVKSTDKGVLIPRMTEWQRDDIVNPEEGLMIYQTDGNKGFYYYDGTAWTEVGKPGELISTATNGLDFGNSGSDILIPDLQASLTLTETSDVLIAYQANARFQAANQYVDVRLFIDNSEVPGIRYYEKNDDYLNICASIVLQEGAGTHSIKVKYTTNNTIAFYGRSLTVKVLGPHHYF